MLAYLTGFLRYFYLVLILRVFIIYPVFVSQQIHEVMLNQNAGSSESVLSA